TPAPKTRRAAARREPARRPATNATTGTATAVVTRSGVTREAARSALGELEALDLAPLVEIGGAGVPVLSRAGQAKISRTTAATVASLGYAIATTPVADVLRGLVKTIGDFSWPGRGQDGGQPNPPPQPARLNAV